jgi:hypothetical protein
VLPRTRWRKAAVLSFRYADTGARQEITMRIASIAFAAGLLLCSSAFVQSATAAPAANTGTTASTGDNTDNDDDDDTATTNTATANSASTNTAATGTQKTGPKHAKREACRAQWDAQTTHSGKKKDFVQACMAKS